MMCAAVSAVLATEPTAAAPVRALAAPKGFGAAPFGMGLAEVWRRYPAAQLLPENAQLGSAAVDGPYIERLVLRDQPVAGFEKPTTVELRFWKDRLWTVIVYFGDNDTARVTADLDAAFGPSAGDDPTARTWPGDAVTVVASYPQRWYGYSDNALSRQAQTWFGAVLRGEWKGPTEDERNERERRMTALTPASGTPGAAPVAPTSAP